MVAAGKQPADRPTARAMNTGARRAAGGWPSKAPQTRNNFVAKKNKKKKNHLEIVFGTTLWRSANFGYAKIDKVENYLEAEGRRFLVRLGRHGSTKISAVFLKYPTFGDGFFMGITSKKFEFPYIVASTLKKLKLKLPWNRR